MSAVGGLLYAWGGQEEEGLDCLVSGVQWKCHNVAVCSSLSISLRMQLMVS